MAKQNTNWRFWLTVAGLAGFALYSGQKLVRSHINPEVRAPDYTFTREQIARRGGIYDSVGGGYPLVQSIPVWEYRLDPVSLTNRVVRRRGEPPRKPAAILTTIAKALNLDPAKVKAMAKNEGGGRYQFLAKSSDKRAHEILKDSKSVAGIAIEDRQIREYLNKGRGRLAHVLGAVNAEHVGCAGVELKFNEELTGRKGLIEGLRDARGNEIYDRRKITVDAVPGSDLFLTIDHNLQFEVETALSDGVKEFGAGSGWCVVLDVKTGAVLALASNPDYDPRSFRSAKDFAKINRVTNYTYEPGSVMKVITACAGVDSGRVRPDSLYTTNRDDDRYYRLPGDGRHVWEPRMSVSDAIVHSSNIVIGKLGYDLGPKTLWTYMDAFGFGHRTGIELPGEESGILPPYAKWDKVKWSRAPIGQGVAVTAIQLASAYQAIANDGMRMKPHIISKIVAADGTEKFRHADEVLGNPIKPSTARAIRGMMLGVASREGTARRAAVRGYSVAGKTGTAQKIVNGRYSEGLFDATFCGIIPSGLPQQSEVDGRMVTVQTDPRLVILVTLDFEERRQFHQGGNSSAPIFRRIATAAMRYLTVEPDRPGELEEFQDDDEFDRIMEARARRLDESAAE